MHACHHAALPVLIPSTWQHLVFDVSLLRHNCCVIVTASWLLCHHRCYARAESGGGVWLRDGGGCRRHDPKT